MTETERLERIELALGALSSILWAHSPDVRQSGLLAGFANEHRERQRAADALLLEEQRARRLALRLRQDEAAAQLAGR